MPRKQILLTSFCKVLGVCLVVFISLIDKTSTVSAKVNSSACESKPRMLKQVTASYARSSYADCHIKPDLCKDMYSHEPQSVVKKFHPVEADLETESSRIKITTPTASASATPSPSPTPVSTPTPTPSAAPSQDSLSADKLFEMINTHRATKGLPAYEKEDRLCELARSRGPELHNEIYGDGYIHQGLQERDLPFWITENMISRDTEEEAFNWWLRSSLHHSGIDSSKKYACGVCVANSCAMLFTSWEPK